MGALQDASRFLEIVAALLAIYLVYGYVQGHDQDFLAVGLVVLGALGLVAVAYRFREDYAPE